MRNLIGMVTCRFPFSRIFKKSESKESVKKSASRDKDVVHHDELNRKSRRKKTDKDDFDIQKFSEPSTEEVKELNNRNFLIGLRLGIGLAFLSMALNGLSDDLLFNMQSSMLMWLLAALAASINQCLIKNEE